MNDTGKSDKAYYSEADLKALMTHLFPATGSDQGFDAWKLRFIKGQLELYDKQIVFI